MKKMFYVGISIFVIMFIVLHNNINHGEEKKDYLVYIDAGHGGFDPGTVYEDIKEKDLNLKIANRLFMKLYDSVVSVKLIRNGDYDLSTDPDNKKRSDIRKRVSLINESNADLLVSIHMNYFTDSYYFGAQTFYTNVNSDSKKVAEIFQENFRNKTDTQRQIKTIDNIFLLDNVKIPAVLIEVGFLSNQKERNLLLTDDYQNLVADVMYLSILSYFNIS